MNTAVGFVLISFLFMLSGCNYYKIVTKTNPEPATITKNLINELYPESIYPRSYYPESNLEIMLWMQHELYVIDSQKNWFLMNPHALNDTLFAQAINKPLPEKDNPDAPNYKRDKKLEDPSEETIKNRVKFYVDTLHFSNIDSVQIPFSAVKKYDFYKRDTRREAGLSIAIVGGLAITAVVVAISVAMANYDYSYSSSNTSSCPYVFTYSEDACHFNGEIFSGAIFRSLERDDYLALSPGNVSAGDPFKVKMVNMLKEVQYINHAELILVNHDTNTRVLIDKYGNVQTLNEIIKPDAAIDSRGNNVMDALSYPDFETYNFNEDPDPLESCMNHIDLVFSSNTMPDSCKLIIKGHNSLWIDLLTKSLLESLGKKYRYFVSVMDRKSSTKQKEWVLSQGLPLQVYVLKENEWQFADYYDIVGPIAAREMVLPLNVKDAWTIDTSYATPRYEMKVRLEAGFNFWELDYAGLDLSANLPVEKIAIQPDWVRDQDSSDVSGMLKQDDRHYLIQEKTGDEALMSFTIPGSYDGSGSIFLHAKGYYHSIVENKEKAPLALIGSFLQPGRLSEFSYENYLKMQEYLAKNTIESE